LNPTILAERAGLTAPLAGAAAGATVTFLLWLLGRGRGQRGLPMRFLGAVAAAWTAVCGAYVAARPGVPFGEYLLTGRLPTEVIAAVGAAFYVTALARFRPAERRWRRSSGLLAGVTLMAAAFLRATQQPEIAVYVQTPTAVLLLATIWRFQAEPLVYLAVLGVAVMIVLAARTYFAAESETPVLTWVTSTGAGVSLAMILIGSLLHLHPRKELNVKWYRQGLLIVPLVIASLAAMGTGYAAVWHGPSWHTVWALAAWWAVLLVSAIGLRQADLFGFSCVGAALAAVVAVAVLGGTESGGWAGRYPAILLLIALGASVLAGLLAAALRHGPSYGFPRALYLAGLATTVGALAIEPFDTSAHYLGIDLLAAAVVLVLGHAHGAPRWINYLVAALATGGVAALTWVGPGASADQWHHRFIQVTASVSVGWLVVAILLREVLKRTHSDREARREIEPFTVFGMTATIVFAAYLFVQEARAYTEFLTEGRSPTLPLLGPDWGLVGWVAVLVAFFMSMWLFRHTVRTLLFYVFGVMATVYVGLFGRTDDLYGYLIYAVGGYGSAHMLVYLYERRFMDLLSRTCALYREERRASTTIFTLAVISTFLAAVLAMFRLESPQALVMLGLMAVVYLGWSFVWLRGEMLYPAVLMVTLTVLAIWHNTAHPQEWNPYRLSMNGLVMGISAVIWLGFGNRLHAIRGEIFQLAAPARACSVILGLVGLGFATALAVSPVFQGEVWHQTRTIGDWAMGLATFSALILYFTWAGFVFDRRFYNLVGVLGVLLLGLYIGLYAGARLAGA